MAQKARRRTLEDIRMSRADHDRDLEELVAERDEWQHRYETCVEQNRQTLEEFDRIYREEISKLRAESARQHGELEALRRYLAMLQDDHRICATYAAGAEAGLEHIERQIEQSLQTVRDIRGKAAIAAKDAHEQATLERAEQAALPAPQPFGAPGTQARAERLPPAGNLPRVVTGNGDADEHADNEEPKQ